MKDILHIQNLCYIFSDFKKSSTINVNWIYIKKITYPKIALYIFLIKKAWNVKTNVLKFIYNLNNN